MAHQIRSNMSGNFSKVVNKSGINVIIPISPVSPPSYCEFLSIVFLYKEKSYIKT